jgi:hypothetical protein
MLVKVYFYDKTGTFSSIETLISVATTTTFTEFILPVYSPSNAAFASVYIDVQNGYTYNITGIALTPIQTNYAVFNPTAVTSFGATRVSLRGTPLVAGDIALSAGWGDTPAASISAISGNDGAFSFTVSAGTANFTANPTATVTFKDGAWLNAPVCVVVRGDATAPTTGFPTVTTSATQAVITFQGTPAAGTFSFNVICMGK